MPITHRIQAAKSKALTWADMSKTINNVVSELRIHGVKPTPDGDFIKSPSNVRRAFIVKGGDRDEIGKVLKDRGFKKDKHGTLGKRVGSWAVAVDLGESGMGVDMEVSVTDFDGPKEEDIGPGHSYYD